MKKLITFKESDYRKALNQSENKLLAWSEVVEQVSKFIQVPNTSAEYRKMLNDALTYVIDAIDSKHRPNINIPIKTEKLLELLEIDLTPLKQALSAYNKHEGNLIVNDSCEVSFVVDKEQFKVYAETETELKKLKASIKLIQAFDDLMLIENKDFKKYGNNKLHELKQATGNLIRWENGELVPSEYWIKQV